MVEPGGRKSRIEVDGLADQPFRLGVLPALKSGNAERMKRIEVVSLNGEKFLVATFRFAQISQLVRLGSVPE